MYFGYMMENKNKENTEEVTSFLKLPVYTREGTCEKCFFGH